MLLEMVLESKFDSRELAKEKDVIIEEIKSGYDNPEDYVYDLFSTSFFDTHSLGYPIAGTEKTVKALTRAHLVDHQEKSRNHLPLCVIAVGKVDHAEVVDVVRKAFRIRSAGKPPRAPEARAPGPLAQGRANAARRTGSRGTCSRRAP